MSKARDVIAEMLADLDGNTDAYAANADFIIDALRAAGLVVVPVEPTEAMLARFHKQTGSDAGALAAAMYKAMLAASQSPQGDQEDK